MGIRPSLITSRHVRETGGAYVSDKLSLGLIEGKDALDLESLRKMYVNLTGKEPTAEELEEARIMLDEATAEDAAKSRP